MKKLIKNIFTFLFNPKLLLCIAIAWIITNGWSYLVFAIGTYYQIPWMIAIGGAYLAFLWLPISPEKIVTIAIAIFLLKTFFPEDQKTLAVLKGMYEKVKKAYHDYRMKRKGGNKDEQNLPKE